MIADGLPDDAWFVIIDPQVVFASSSSLRLSPAGTFRVAEPPPSAWKV